MSDWGWRKFEGKRLNNFSDQIHVCAKNLSTVIELHGSTGMAGEMVWFHRSAGVTENNEIAVSLDTGVLSWRGCEIWLGDQ